MSRLESLYIPKEALELVVDEGDHQPISLKEYLDAYMEQGSPVTFSDGTIRMDFYCNSEGDLAEDFKEVEEILEGARIPYYLQGEGIGYGEREAKGLLCNESRIYPLPFRVTLFVVSRKMNHRIFLLEE